MNPNPRYTLVVSTCAADIDILSPSFTLFREYTDGAGCAGLPQHRDRELLA